MVRVTSTCAGCSLGIASHPSACPFHTIERSAGMLLFSQGELLDTIVYLERGQVLLSTAHEDGDETSCALRGPGSLLGLEALRARTSDADAWALTDVKVCRIALDQLDHWLARDPARSRAVLELSIDETSRSRQDRVALAGSAEVRIARFLVEHARTKSGPLELEQQVLARMLRLRPETVSRALSSLRARGALTKERGLKVADLALLSEIANPNA